MTENYLTNYPIIFLTFTLILCIMIILNRKTLKNTHTTGNKIMTKATKAANYTAQNVEFMVATYSAATDATQRTNAVAVIAQELGKNAKSVIAKLSREGVYVKATKVTKTGAKVETKAEVVAQIAEKLELDAESIKSLTNATKAALVALREAS